MSRGKDRLLKCIKAMKNSCYYCYNGKISTWTAVYKDPQSNIESDVPKAIRTFFKKKNKLYLLNDIPKNYMRKKSSKDNLIIVDPKIAVRIGHVICSRFDGNHLIEFDPGLGYMSNILITSTPQLKLCETDPELRSKLEVFKLKYKDKVEIHDISFSLLLKGLTSRRSSFINRTEAFFAGLPERSWKDAPNISFVLTVVGKQLIRTISRRMVLDKNFYKLGRLEFYYLVPARIYQKLVATPDNEFKRFYRSTAVLFQTVFDFDVLLDGIPRWVILPWPSRNRHLEDLVVLRAIPKISFFETFKNQTLISGFFNFLNDNMRKNKRIIPSIETQVMNCGPVFIMKYNLTSYSEFIELQPKELLSLFLRLSELPSFKHSSLYSSGKSVVDDTDDDTDSDEESVA